MQWKPQDVWFSINAFFAIGTGGAHRLQCWYVNFEHPARRTGLGFDTLDLVVDLVIAPDLNSRGGRIKTSTRTCDGSESSVTTRAGPSEPPGSGPSRCSRCVRAPSRTPAPGRPGRRHGCPAEPSHGSLPPTAGERPEQTGAPDHQHAAVPRRCAVTSARGGSQEVRTARLTHACAHELTVVAHTFVR
ncbi:DUF402 domain-containing protein [Streptomyces sp. MTZ3.1]|uniref:DUF402 domain-containing protein n=1 Tax=Streptomyces meridianus TaxID=2938945 RepID=A0ABT0XB41_9ACTN|nr:DUF402 domain-containing protein [Streptomyces meridianus]MCM2579620.1 DUF402 domain-containing protein [Streptomyces meridianus]